ncbi:DNA-binding protein HU [Spirochaetia bacterium]|nr:DNA-binding protein HU [Spirochaetia bacterium]
MTEKKVTKGAIVDWVAERSGVNAEDVKTVINLFFEAVKGILTRGDAIELRGFGTFEVRTRKGKDKARNPKTGEVVSIEPHRVAVFKPGKALKGAVWNLDGTQADK